MRKAMYEAEVGDDVFREDPTVNAFQEEVAAMFGMESGVFVPSGTMGNQLALNVQSRPGDEVICDRTAHIYNYESAAGPFLSGIQFALLQGEQGILRADQIETGFRGHNDWDPPHQHCRSGEHHQQGRRGVLQRAGPAQYRGPRPTKGCSAAY